MLHLYNGQQRECSKQNFHRHFLRGSNLNNNTGLKQRQHLICVLSNGNNSSAPQEDDLRIAAQTFPLQDQCSSVRESKQQRSYPPHQQHCSSASLSGQASTYEVSTVGEIQPPTDNQILEFIAKRLAYFQTILSQRRQNYGDTHCVKGWKFCTNDFTLQSDCIVPKSKSVAQYPALSISQHLICQRQSLNCAVTEQCTTTVIQALEEDSSKGSNVNPELSLKSEETGDCTTSAPEKHSTDYTQIMMKVAGTGTENEDESPVVSAIESGVTMDELTELDPSLTLKINSSEEDYKCPQLNISTTLDDTDQVPGVCLAPIYMTEKEKRDTGLKLPEALGQVSKDLQTKSSSVVSKKKTLELSSVLENQNANAKKRKHSEGQQHCTSKDVIAHFTRNSVEKIQIHNVVSLLTNQSQRLCNQISHEGVRENAGSLPSRNSLSVALSENKVKEQATSKCEEAPSVNILKDPLYEDISDDEDFSQLAKKTLNMEEFSLTACLKDPQYEDISEDENCETDIVSVERSSLTQVPECHNKESPFESKGYGHVQAQAQMKTELTSDEELIPKKHGSSKTQTHDKAQHYSCLYLIETDEGLSCPKCGSKRDLGWQTNHSVSCSPPSILKNEDEADGQMNEDWIVIPISMSDLRFKPEDEDQDDPENVLLVDCETGHEERQNDITPTHHECHQPAPKPVSASNPDQIEVFDTFLNFVHAKAPQFRNRFVVILDRSQSEYIIDSEGEPHTPQNRRESFSGPEDSCDTEDSCDYSSGTEHNYLTVSRQLLKKRSEHLPPETDDSESDKEGENNEVTNVRKGKTRSFCKFDSMQKATAGSQNIPPKAKGSADSRDAPCVQQNRRSLETVDSENGTAKEKLQETTLSLLLQHQSKQKSRHLIKAKDCSEYVKQTKTIRQTTSRDFFHDSEKAVTKDNSSKKKSKTKNILSSGLEDSDSLFTIQNRRSTKTVDHTCGTAKGKPEITLPFDGLPEKQPQSVDKEARPNLRTNPVIPCLVAHKPAYCNEYLKLAKQSRMYRQDKNETQAAKTPTATTKKTDSCEMDMRHLCRNKKRKFVSKPKPANGRYIATKSKVLTRPRLVSRHLMLLSQEDPSTSINSSPPTGGKLSEARQRSASSRALSQSGETSSSPGLTKSKQNTSLPRHHLSPSIHLQWSHNEKNPSTLDNLHTSTGPSSSAIMQSTARKQVTKDWQNSFFPIKRDRKTSLGMEDDLRATNHNSEREGRPGPSHYDRAPRQRHNSHDFATPLMKKTKIDAIQWTKAISRDAPREHRHFVGEGYKWSEKPTVAKPTKGSGSREGMKR